MPWGKLDDQLHDNEKVWSFTDKEFRVWMYSISYCNKKRRRDPVGTLTQEAAETVCRLAGATRKVIPGIVQKRGWDRADLGYIVHDFPVYGPKPDQTATDRQRRHRDKEDGHTDSHASVTRPSRRDAHVRGSPVPVPGPVPSTADETAEVDEASTASPMERARALAVPKPGQVPGSPQFALSRALATSMNCAEPTTRQERERWAEAISGLLQAAPPVTPDEVPGLVAAYDEHFTTACSPRALASNLTRLRAPRPPRQNGRNGAGSSRAALDRVTRRLTGATPEPQETLT